MSFPRYPKYKDSGVEWLGEVPEGWRLPRIKAISRISGGGTPSREIPEYWNGDIPWVSPKDMKAERISSAEESITPLGLAQSTSSLHPPNRILMVIRSGILQRVIPVAINDATVAINQDMKAFAFDSHACLPAFFLRWVQGLNDRLLLEWAHQGATVESINQSLMQNTVIPLPPLPEQSAITNFLDRETAKIDALIAEQQRLIELLQEKRQAVISHAVTKGLNPDARMKDSGIEWLGEVPEHWVVGKLGHYLLESPCYGVLVPDFDPNGIPMLRINDLTDDRVDRGELTTISRLLSDQYTRSIVCEGDLVISVVGQIGVARVIGPELAGVNLSRNVARIQFNNRMRACFARWLFAADQFRHYTDLTCVGTAQLLLNMSSITAFVTVCPPLEEQAAITTFIDSRTAQCDTLEVEAHCAIALLQERRSALISAAVTGQIDVRGLAGSEAA